MCQDILNRINIFIKIYCSEINDFLDLNSCTSFLETGLGNNIYLFMYVPIIAAWAPIGNIIGGGEKLFLT